MEVPLNKYQKTRVVWEVVIGGNSGPATMVNKMNNDLGNSAP